MHHCQDEHHQRRRFTFVVLHEEVNKQGAGENLGKAKVNPVKPDKGNSGDDDREEMFNGWVVGQVIENDGVRIGEQDGSDHFNMIEGHTAQGGRDVVEEGVKGHFEKSWVPSGREKRSLGERSLGETMFRAVPNNFDLISWGVASRDDIFSSHKVTKTKPPLLLRKNSISHTQCCRFIENTRLRTSQWAYL